jgi:hypothetical protein
MSDASSERIDFGSDLSLKACIGNCLEGECCDCDYHRGEQPAGSEAAAGQPPTTPGPHRHLTAKQSLQSVASSDQGPSQPRPIVHQQQYHPTDSMQYDLLTSDDAGQEENQPGNSESGYSGYPGSHHGGGPYHHQQYYGGGHYGALGTSGGVHLAPQHPSGFTTQASSYDPGAGADITRYQQSMGYYRDGAGQLHNSSGQPIDEQGRVLQLLHGSAASAPPSLTIPHSYGATTTSESGSPGESFQTAPSHISRLGGGGGSSNVGSARGSSRQGKKKQKKQ